MVVVPLCTEGTVVSLWNIAERFSHKFSIKISIPYVGLSTALVYDKIMGEWPDTGERRLFGQCGGRVVLAWHVVERIRRNEYCCYYQMIPVKDLPTSELTTSVL